MKYTQGQNRTQTCLFPRCLDETIDPENEVRIIDLFVASITLSEYGFTLDFGENGRPAYHLRRIINIIWYKSIERVAKGSDCRFICDFQAIISP